jgi:hypothetical protein
MELCGGRTASAYKRTNTQYQRLNFDFASTRNVAARHVNVKATIASVSGMKLSELKCQLSSSASDVTINLEFDSPTPRGLNKNFDPSKQRTSHNKYELNYEYKIS